MINVVAWSYKNTINRDRLSKKKSDCCFKSMGKSLSLWCSLVPFGCVAARICNANNCPAGIATQKPELRKNLDIEKSSVRLHNFFNASVELMQVMARACGHNDLSKFNENDLATWHREMALLSGVTSCEMDLIF